MPNPALWPVATLAGPPLQATVAAEGFHGSHSKKGQESNLPGRFALFSRVFAHHTAQEIPLRGSPGAASPAPAVIFISRSVRQSRSKPVRNSCCLNKGVQSRLGA